ncbi:MAG: DUF1801 domain-containing protein [Chitinophagaceae bacterium]|nr:DUF1801 domain-containing protein [Chitinophagaceae bacterium]
MAKTENQTVETKKSVSAFIKTVTDKAKQEDCFKLIELMEALSGYEAKMWGPAIVGFGSYHYVYESGREGDAPLVAFSPRKDSISLYLSLGADERVDLLKQFGKHKSAKSCIYVKKLEDISVPVLKKMIRISLKRQLQKNK